MKGIPGGANQLVIAALVLALVVAALSFAGFRPLATSRWGRYALLVGLALLPLSLTGASLSMGVAESSRTRFCLQCHEMKDYGKSLFVDDRHSLPAVHYQNRLIDRDRMCFSCHTDYGLFGDMKAKLNGLRHVYVHYLSKAPDKIALYQPYPNRNCLHCHEDARRFVEAVPHQPVLAQIQKGEMSCLACHKIVHDMNKVHANELWQAQ